jgi:hypothetical protein
MGQGGARGFRQKALRRAREGRKGGFFCWELKRNIKQRKQRKHREF